MKEYIILWSEKHGLWCAINTSTNKVELTSPTEKELEEMIEGGIE